MIEKTISKKSILFVSGIGAIIAAFWLVSYYIGLCAYGSECQQVVDEMAPILFVDLFLAPPIFLFSILLHFLNDRAYKIWLNFSFVWLLLMGLIYATTFGGGSEIGLGMIGALLSLMYVVYLVGSLSIILFHASRNRKGK